MKNKITPISLLFGILFLCVGCNEEDPVLISPPPHIISLEPPQGIPGERVVITGEYFGDESSSLVVYVGDSEVPIQSGPTDDSVIEIEIPSDVAFGDNFVRLKRGDKYAQAPYPLVIAHPAADVIKDVSLIGRLSVDQARQLLIAASNLPSFQGIEALGSLFQYGVEYYKVTYTSQFKGRSVQSSTLLTLPLAAPSVPLLVICHGTITHNDDAPSVSVSNVDFDQLKGLLASSDLSDLLDSPNDLNSVSNLLYGVSSSLGYVCVLPDYLGFGASKDEVAIHPYYHAESLSEDVISAIQAARAAARKKNQAIEEDTYLMGYSQGGYVAIATQRALENAPRQGIQLQLVGAGAGAYDLSGVKAYLDTQIQYSYPSLVAYLVVSYQYVYGEQIKIGEVFKNPNPELYEYAGIDCNLPEVNCPTFEESIIALFNKTTTSDDINKQFSVDLNELLKEEFRVGAENREVYKPLLDALAENSLLNWTPKTRLLLYHGTIDDRIPYYNTERTYRRLSARAGDLVSLHPVQERDHNGAITPFFAGVLTAILTGPSSPEESNP